MNYVPCKQEEATHIRVTDERYRNDDQITFGKIYEYLYDPHPSEQTYYFIMDNEIPFYDFECVMKPEYLKKVSTVDEVIEVNSSIDYAGKSFEEYE